MRKGLIFGGITAVLMLTVVSACGKSRVQITGPNSVYAAAERGEFNAVQDAILQGFQINAPDDRGLSVLHHAAAYNQASLLDELIDRYGANPAAKDSAGRTPLDIAMQVGAADAIRVLEPYESGK